MREVHYFSNGCEGMDWMASHCDVCAHDSKFQRTQGAEDGCPLVVSMVCGIPESDLVEDDDELWICKRFGREVP